MAEKFSGFNGLGGTQTFHGDPPPGYMYGKAKDTYMVDPLYIDADRKPIVMPVNPDYQIRSRGILLGSPRVIIGDHFPENPFSRHLPALTSLLDTRYYRLNFMSGDIGYAELAQKVASPIEIRPRVVADDVLGNPFLDVQYTYGVQFLHDNPNRGMRLRGAKPRVVHNGKIEAEKAATNDFEGLAYVAHVRVPTDLSKFFQTPRDLKDFTRDVPFSAEEASERAREIYHDVFNPKLETIAQQVSEMRKQPVKGIVLSPITPNSGFKNDIYTGKPINPQGELVMAASYLV